MRATTRVLAVAVALSFGCSDSNGPGAPGPLSALKIVSGKALHATVGTALASPIVVQAVDAQSRAIPGLTVTFTVLSGGGQVAAVSATTNGQGQASTTWTLGTSTADTQQVSATVNSSHLTLVDTLTASATAGPPKGMVKSNGDLQTAYPSMPLAESLAVRMVDQYNNPAAGATVTWAVTQGGGSLSPASSVANAAGIATTQWTMGKSAGQNAVTASVAGQTASFRATAGGNPNVVINILERADTTRALGDTLTLQAVVTDQNGITIPSAVVTWSTDSTLLSVVSTGNLSGRATVKAVGATRVMASYGGSFATTPIVMSQLLAQLTFQNALLYLVVGQSAHIAFQAADSNGYTMPDTAVHWQLYAYRGSNGVASVSQSGVVSGLTPGTTVVQAIGTDAGVRVAVTRQAWSDARFVQIVNGRYHECALTAMGESWCWGADSRETRNAFGCYQYGGAYTGSDTPITSCPPVPTDGGLTFTTLGASSFFTCGLTSSGAVYCWGASDYILGQGGSGLAIDEPTAVAGVPAFTSITVGATFACGLTSAGAAYCWGVTQSGELGNGTSGQGLISGPVAVSGNLAFTQISAGEESVCGLLASGGAYCWGDNQFGEIGNQSVDMCVNSLPCSQTPLAVAGGHAFKAIAVGGTTACGLDMSGTLYCWGNDNDNELGGPATSSCVPGPCSPTPVAVAGGHTFASIGPGSCAIDVSGQAYCWGVNAVGQVGDGQMSASLAAPAPVVGGHSFTAIAQGFNWTGYGWSSCGIITGGSQIYCWGSDSTGTLGTNATNGQNTATPQLVVVPALSPGNAFANRVKVKSSVCASASARRARQCARSQ